MDPTMDKNETAGNQPPAIKRRATAIKTACAVVSLAFVGLAANQIQRHQRNMTQNRFTKLEENPPFDIIPIHEPTQSRAKRRLAKSCSLANTDLLLPLHSKDMPFASTLFKSIEMNLPCFKDLIVVVPPESAEEVGAVVPSWAKTFVVPEPLPEPFGYLSQQVIKIYSDKFTTGEYVFILEADMVFTNWKDECFFGEGGTVRAYCVNFERDNADPIWRKGTEHALWRTVEDDCVVNTPFIFPREVFPALRWWINYVHKKSYEQFMEDYYEGHSKGWTPDEKLFSEFNILNHYMLYFHPEWVEKVITTDEAWADIGQCSQHIGGLVNRNYDLENPKLTNEYFALAHEAMNKPAEHEKLELDLSD